MTDANSDVSMSEILTRLEKLESGNFLNTQLRCKGLSINDRNGQCRILVTLTDEDEPVIAILREDGNAAASIEAIDGRPEVALYRQGDDDNNDAIKLTVCEAGDGHIFVSRSESESFAHFGTLTDGGEKEFGISIFGSDQSGLFAKHFGDRASMGVSSRDGQVAFVALIGDEETRGDEAIVWTNDSGEVDKVIDGDSE